MKPVDFAYERPRTIADAVGLLADEALQIKILAGGQSLGPMLNMRLVQPDVIVDITAIDELKRVEKGTDDLLIGACVTHADIEDGRVPDVTGGAMQGVAAGIAYRAVRNRGTIGGSLTNADPSADWVSALAALGVKAVVRGKNGARTMPVEDYMTGALENALDEGELLEAVRVPILSASAKWGYYKVCRKTGEYANAIGAVLLDEPRGVCRVVVGATEKKPLVLADAKDVFGGRAGQDCFSHFDGAAVDRLLQAAGMDDAIDRKIHVVALGRAVQQAGRA